MRICAGREVDLRSAARLACTDRLMKGLSSGKRHAVQAREWAVEERGCLQAYEAAPLLLVLAYVYQLHYKRRQRVRRQ